MSTSRARSARRPVPWCLLLAACASPTEKAVSVQRVDDLLARVESVQVESAASKVKARAAIDSLDAICSPDFTGDAKEAYAHLLDCIDASDRQASRLRASIEPMRLSAESDFRQWTADLEAFGSTRMRQRSQVRLEETQARYRNVYATAQSARISHDAFNADLRDHALFLSHDMNVSAVAELSGDLKLLRDVLAELDGRMDACAAAARVYLEAASLYGTSEAPDGANDGAPVDPTSSEEAGTEERSSTLQPASTAPATQGPIGPPAPQS